MPACNISFFKPKPQSDSLRTYKSVVEAVSGLNPEDPLRCLMASEIKKNAEAFVKGFPGYSFYAVKANPDADLIKLLIKNGINNFDVASLGEVELVRSISKTARLAFMHPVKSRHAIREAYFKHNVRVFVLDTQDEMDKILCETKGAKDITLVVRLFMPKGSALCSLSGKFGTTPDIGIELLKSAAASGNKVGLSFHVGSQSMDTKSYANAIKTAGEVIVKSGCAISVLDIGGGFPIPYLGEQPPLLSEFFSEIRNSVNALNLPKTCELWCEPGRAISGTAEVLVARVELRKGDKLYLNDGTFGNLFEIGSMHWKNKVELIREGKALKSDNLASFEFFGPTCDSVDHMQGPFMLPSDTKMDDYIAIYGLGAYGSTSKSTFNGFNKTQKVLIKE